MNFDFVLRLNLINAFPCWIYLTIPCECCLGDLNLFRTQQMVYFEFTYSTSIFFLFVFRHGMVTETLCFLDAKIVVFVHGAKFECMHASLQTMGFRKFRIFRIFGIFEISELQCYQDKCSIMYQQTNWSSHPILFIHTHTNALII